MTNQEILTKIERAERALKTDLPEDAKTKLRQTLETLKAQVEKTEEKIEKKEEKLQADEKKIQSEIEKKIERAEKALKTDLPEDAKAKLRTTLEGLKKEVEKQKAEIKEDKKESEAEKKEIRAAVKKVTELAKKAGKVKTKRKVIPKPEIKEDEREKKSEKRQSKLKGMMSELEILINKNKYLKAKYEGKGVDLERDASRPAKPFGYRFTGKDNYGVPTKEQIKKGMKDGSVDYEGRPNRSDKGPKKQYKLAHGGDVDNENAEMVLSKAKELEHHADELKNVVKPNSKVEAWEVAKMERAATDASDVTHYEDGKKMYMKKGGYMAKGGKIGDYKVGDIVKVSKNNDNENYDDFRGKKLKIVEKITIKDKHPAFDESLDDQALYSFEDAENEDSIPFSLYDYELESAVMAKGGMADGIDRHKVINQYSDEKLARIYSNMKDLDYSDVLIEIKGNSEERKDIVNEIFKELVRNKDRELEVVEKYYAKGGKLSSKAKYIPKRDIEEVEVDENGKEKTIDGADLLDGIYVKKRNKKAPAKKKATKKASGGEVKPKSNRGGNVGQIVKLAKEIRKDGEKWTDAVKRASAQLKK